MKPLINRLPPKESESVYSLLYRNATKNYCDNLMILLNEIRSRIHRGNCNYFEDQLSWVPEFTDLLTRINQRPDHLILNKYDRFFSDFMKSQHQIGYFYLRNHTKFCPHCLKEDFYHRLIWDVSFVTVCLKHEAYLMDECPACKKKITLSKLMKNECQCGFSFTTLYETEKPNSLVLDSQQRIQACLTEEEKGVFLQNGDFLSAKDYFFFFTNFCNVIDNIPGNDSFFDVTGTNVETINFRFQNNIPRNVNMIVFGK